MEKTQEKSTYYKIANFITALIMLPFIAVIGTAIASAMLVLIAIGLFSSVAAMLVAIPIYLIVYPLILFCQVLKGIAKGY